MIVVVKKDLETGEIVDTFEGFTINSIAKKAGVDRSRLYQILKGIRKSAGGFTYEEISNVATGVASGVGESVATSTESVATSTESVATSTESVATDNTLTTGSAGIETRSLPKTRKSIDWFLDPNTDYKDEPHRTIFNVDFLTPREWDYVNWVWDKVSNLPIGRRREGHLIYKDRNELEGHISNHLKGGWKYKREPAETIRRACELQLLDLYMDKELLEFSEKFA